MSMVFAVHRACRPFSNSSGDILSSTHQITKTFTAVVTTTGAQQRQNHLLSKLHGEEEQIRKTIKETEINAFLSCLGGGGRGRSSHKDVK